MKNYSQAKLDELVRCAKIVTQPPKREMSLDRGAMRNDMELTSANGEEVFEVFLRQSEAFPENFSIGLIWRPREDPERVCLIRCNGPHGEFLGQPSGLTPHYGHHIHLATEASIAAGEKPEGTAGLTTEFASFEQAIAFFIVRCNLPDAWQYFPQAKPAPLFDKLENQT
ncbi:MAG: hypothetical protein ACP5I8_08210 [Phycisphaerae bacterium]